jgi:predicted MFS family arabinose efflux permease
LWFVSISPSVAALTSENARPKAFSIIFGWGIALGIVAGMTGGQLPGLVTHYGLAASPREAKQVVLFASAALAALALWPLARLRIEPPRRHETRSYPRGPFIRRFLLAIGVWSFAMGLFGPLFNAYFSRQFRMPVERIGMVFSFAQAAQVIAILSAPLLLRRLGLTRGVAVMQLATALVLALLAPAQVALLAAVLYTSYASFQYMSEPGIYSSLMNRVAANERGGASALNFLVIFVAQALAATAAGAVVARFGYAPMLIGAAVIAACAAVLFWRLPKPAAPTT